MAKKQKPSLIFYDLEQCLRFAKAKMRALKGPGRDKILDGIKDADVRRILKEQYPRSDAPFKRAMKYCNIFHHCRSKNCIKCKEYLDYAEKQ